MTTLWTREDLAWAAGLFEGEGYITYGQQHSDSVRLRLGLNITDEDVIRQFHKIVGVGTLSGPHVRPGSHHKPIWTWYASSFEAAQALIAAFYPWLHSRRRAKALETLKAVADSRASRSYRRYGHCGRGHSRAGGNAYRQGDTNNWICRVCRRENDKANLPRRQRKAEKAAKRRAE